MATINSFSVEHPSWHALPEILALNLGHLCAPRLGPPARHVLAEDRPEGGRVPRRLALREGVRALHEQLPYRALPRQSDGEAQGGASRHALRKLLGIFLRKPLKMIPSIK